MKYAIVLIAAALISCSDTGTIGNYTAPPAPPKTEKVELGKIRESVEKVDKANEAIGNGLKENDKNLLIQKAKIEQALAQAEKIKERALAKQAMTEIEALNLEKILKEIAEENNVLKIRNDDLSKKVEEQSAIIQEAKDNEKKAQEDLALMEEELLLYRTNYPIVSQNLYKSETEKIELQKELKKLEKDFVKEKEKSASRGVYKNWVIGLAVAIALYFVVKMALMKYGIRI